MKLTDFAVLTEASRKAPPFAKVLKSVTMGNKVACKLRN
jgi:hypothetical protein